jgi:hypothetical protein
MTMHRPPAGLSGMLALPLALLAQGSPARRAGRKRTN